jgi:hypothetical protein
MTEAADLDPREEHMEDRVDPIGELEEVQIRKKSHQTTSPQLGRSFRIQEAYGNGAYRLETLQGETLPRTWNVMNLKFYYS